MYILAGYIVTIFIYHYFVSLYRLKESVSIQEVTVPEIVCYHPQHDLLPLVLAHCNYSLTAGRGAQIQYDFAALENVIAERFIANRPRLIADVRRVWFDYFPYFVHSYFILSIILFYYLQHYYL